MGKDDAIPIQPVENPILCSPYSEPDQHWLYDTRTGIPSKNPGRRPASYWFKTERTGSAQMSLLAEEERDDLPLVNALRADVRRWRESGWENPSERTKKLLRHWWRADRARRLFFCQVEAVETIIYLREMLALGKKPRWTPKLTPEDFRALAQGRNPRPEEWVAQMSRYPKLADIPNEPGSKPIPRHACKMAIGSGKTVVMCMLIAWAFCNRGTKPGDPRFPRRALVVCPNLTIKERLAVLRPGEQNNYSTCGIEICVDLSATPFYIHGSGYPEGSPFPWIVSDFSLVDAIESGITKIPGLPAIDNTGRPDPKYFRLWEHITRDLRPGETLNGGKPKPEVVYRKAEDALLTLAGEWRERFDVLQVAAPGQDRAPPVMIVVCDNTDVAGHFFRMISRDELIEADAPGDDEEDEDERAKRGHQDNCSGIAEPSGR